MKRSRIRRYVGLERKAWLRPRRKSGEKRGKHTGKIRLYGKKLTGLRWAVFRRAKGFCELRHVGCYGWISWKQGQMHHVVHRSLGGEDTELNCRWSCRRCHRKEHE